MNDELYHYGVLGMKWGVRKQPTRSSGFFVSRSKRKAQKKRQQALAKARATKQANQEYARAKNEALKRGSANDILRFKGDLTNQEMNDAINRLNSEQRLSQLAASQPKKVNKGKSYVRKVLGDAMNQSVQNVANQLVDAGMTYVVNEIAIPAVGLGSDYKVSRKYNNGQKKKDDN